MSLRETEKMLGKIFIAPYLIVILALAFKLQAQQRLRCTNNYCNTKLNIYADRFEEPLLTFRYDRPFLSIAKSEGEVKYKRAAFKFKDNIKQRCVQQVVTETVKRPNEVIVKGHFEDCDCAYEICLTTESDSSAASGISFELNLSDTTYNRIYFSFSTQSDERFFGFGIQPTHVNMKGKKPFVFTEEQGIGRGDRSISTLTRLGGAAGNEYTTYASVPFFISTAKRALMVENTGYMRFDFEKAHKATLEVWDNHLKGTFWMAETPLQLLEYHTQKAGRFPPLPDWAYGTWMGLQGGAEKTKQTVLQAIEAGNPVTALWIQDWVGRRKTRFGSQLWWRWQADSLAYPDLAKFCQTLNQQHDVKVLGYVNSFLATEGEMYQHAKKQGYLVKNAKGEDYLIDTGGFPAVLVDLTNPQAYDWLKNIIKNNLIGNGMSGWMADFAEWLPPDAVLHNDADPLKYHNLYPVDWVKLNREAVKETGKSGEIVFFNRAGYEGSAKYSTLFWLGDQMVSWGKNDGLPSVVPAMLSGGISGITLNHSDIGGYTTVSVLFFKYHRSHELFYRWAELEALTPIFRTHEGLQPQKNHQAYTDAETVDFFADMGKLHFALKDYMKHLVSEASEKGYPPVRHLYLHYPDDEHTYDLQYQFLLGSDMLVLPVLQKKATRVKGYFPNGQWRHIWTGKIYEGKQWHKVSAPLGKPAAFVLVGGEWSQRILEALTLVTDK